MDDITFVWLTESWDDPFLSPTTESVLFTMDMAKKEVESWTDQSGYWFIDTDYEVRHIYAVPHGKSKQLIGAVREMRVFRGIWEEKRK